MSKKQANDEKKSRDWKYEVESLFGQLLMNSHKYNIGVILENDYEDFNFWKYIITTAVPSLKPCCVVTANFALNSTAQTATGKSDVMKFKDVVNEKLIICRDADNCLLYENSDATYLTKPYIYHTYTYDREAHYAYPKNLQEVCNELTFRDFDFENIVTIYSETVFPFLVYWLHSQINPNLYFDLNEKGQKETWKEIGWNFVESYILLPIDEIEVSEMEFESKTTLKTKIAEWAEIIKAKFLVKNDWHTAETFSEEINEIQTKILQIIPKNQTFFYLNGHKTVEKFMFPFAKKVIEELGNSQKQDINTRLQESYKLGNPFMDKIKADFCRDFSIKH